MENNTIDQEKSKVFTEVLKKKEFRFPAQYVAGNPSTRKEYDEGYLILDAEGKLFHMKQTQGRPYVRAIPLPEGLNAKYLFITEFQDRKTLGYITDVNNNFYVLKNKTYEVIKTGLPSYNPETDNFPFSVICLTGPYASLRIQQKSIMHWMRMIIHSSSLSASLRQAMECQDFVSHLIKINS